MYYMSAIHRIRTEVFRVSQGEMARIAGVTQPTVSRWEAGASSPTLQEVERIRAAAKQRRLRWNDRFLFETPSVSAGLSDGPSAEVAA
jgi:predicted transcriptional regulator